MSDLDQNWEPAMMSLPESYISDCKHLKQLLNSNSFEGTPEQRSSLLNKLLDLEGEFSSISLDKMRENYKNKTAIFPEWNRRYCFVKLAVYKACGYTIQNERLNNIFG